MLSGSKGFIRQLIVTTTAVFILCSGGLTFAEATSRIDLKLPTETKNGIFVVSIDSPYSESFTHTVEIYRNIDGGDFQLVSAFPGIQALSQSISSNGNYGYKIRLVSDQGGVLGESNTRFIRVKLRNQHYALFAHK